MKDHIIIMGVASCGKSTIGAKLGERLNIPFLDGDTLHPKQNIEKMSAGVSLTDEDRWPWLDAVGQSFENGKSRIIACSALKRAYRTRIVSRAGTDVLFVHLAGERHVLEGRMKARTGHFMPTTLLDSQLETLEPPIDDEHAITVDISAKTDAIVDAIVIQMKEKP